MSADDQPQDFQDEDEGLFLPLVGVILIGGFVYLTGLLVWAAGQVSALITNGRWPDSDPSDAIDVLIGLVQSPGDPAGGWPAAAAAGLGPAWLVYLIALVMFVPVACLVFVVVQFVLDAGRIREFRWLRRGFASGWEINRILGAKSVLRRAAQARPSLRGQKRVALRDVGFYLGRDMRTFRRLFASVEDTAIILAPPRQGKDVHFCTPFTIDAPGACIVTSADPDAFNHTYALRRKVGTIRVFDPNGLTNWPDKQKWSPVSGCEDPMIAGKRAGTFVNTSGLQIVGSMAYMVASVISILRCYLHAAAIGGYTMKDVVRWTHQPTNTEPIRALRNGEAAGTAAPGWAGQLASFVSTDDETRTGLWSGLVQALACFSDPGVLDACSPSPEEEFSLEEFLAGRNTLYVLGAARDHYSIAPLVTVIMEDMIDNARAMAKRMPAGRLDPPLTVELNEAARIAPVPSLAVYMGYCGASSIAIHVYWQALSQARAKWGDNGTATIWGNAGVRMIMGGASHAEDLEDISEVLGEARGNVLLGGEKRPVLSQEEIRTLKFGRALVVARSARPVEAILTPWWKRADAQEITEGKVRMLGKAASGTERWRWGGTPRPARQIGFGGAFGGLLPRRRRAGRS